MDKRLRFGLLMAIVGMTTFGGSVLATSDGQDELAVVRQVTAQFHDIDSAKAAGYELGYVNGAGNRIITGCIAHPTAGVMGYHYFNKRLIDDLVIDPQKPEGLVYTSGPEGQLKLVAVERRSGCELQPARGIRAADRARTSDAHPGSRCRLLHPAFLGLES